MCQSQEKWKHAVEGAIQLTLYTTSSSVWQLTLSEPEALFRAVSGLCEIAVSELFASNYCKVLIRLDLVKSRFDFCL